MLDDFTALDREGKAPVEAVVDRLKELRRLGFNAIEFMPWTAWRNQEFDWGYEPCQFFAVETRYTRDESDPREHLSRLKVLVDACHRQGLHVIMDGVFNHTSVDFPYGLLYREPADCPLVGTFGKAFDGLQELDFDHPATADFIVEACTYWIDEFGIDGIRFDAALYLVDAVLAGRGLPEIIARLQTHVADRGLTSFPLVLEYLDLGAVRVVNELGADGYWDDALMQTTNDGLAAGRIGPALLAALTPRADLGPGRAPCAYLSNHDHSQVLWRVGHGQVDDALGRWWRLQPYLIALFTGPAVPLVPNGQEIGELHVLPDDEHGTRRRILSRPVHWSMATDPVGRTLHALHVRLAALRHQHPALRSAVMQPSRWEGWQTRLDPATGLGLDVDRQLVLYRRSAPPQAGAPGEDVLVVLNFADGWQEVDVRFPGDGTWTDGLAGFDGGAGSTVEVVGGHAVVEVGGNWGRVLTR
jgi:1,4-alpha-glucan branching enzyme